jgi:predicted ribosome quality control (RQC) complex YloA/Tae2 family protein
VVRNPERLERLPRATERFAAALAAGYSKARSAGRVAVHACRGEDVSKHRGQPPGEVTLERWRSLTVEPLRAEDLGGATPP